MDQVGNGNPEAPRTRAGRLLAWSLVAAVLALVFVAYQDPSLLITLSNAVWSCF